MLNIKISFILIVVFIGNPTKANLLDYAKEKLPQCETNYNLVGEWLSTKNINFMGEAKSEFYQGNNSRFYALGDNMIMSKIYFDNQMSFNNYKPNQLLWDNVPGQKVNQAFIINTISDGCYLQVYVRDPNRFNIYFLYKANLSNSLQNHIYNLPNFQMYLPLRISLVIDIVSAVDNLIKNNIAIWDFKLETIFMNEGPGTLYSFPKFNALGNLKNMTHESLTKSSYKTIAFIITVFLNEKIRDKYKSGQPENLGPWTPCDDNAYKQYFDKFYCKYFDPIAKMLFYQEIDDLNLLDIAVKLRIIMMTIDIEIEAEANTVYDAWTSALIKFTTTKTGTFVSHRQIEEAKKIETDAKTTLYKKPMTYKRFVQNVRPKTEAEQEYWNKSNNLNMTIRKKLLDKMAREII